MTKTKKFEKSLWEELNLCTSLFSRVGFRNTHTQTHTQRQGGRRAGCWLEVAPFKFPSWRPLKDLLQSWVKWFPQDHSLTSLLAITISAFPRARGKKKKRFGNFIFISIYQLWNSIALHVILSPICLQHPQRMESGHRVRSWKNTNF